MATGVEIHVPISPTESFFRQVHYLLESLRLRGGRLSQAPVIVTVGEDCEPFDVARRLTWSRNYPVEFRWVPRHWYREKFATGMDRCRHDFREDWVLLLDADMVLSRDFDDLLDRAAADPAVYGIPCHGSPFQPGGFLNVRPDEEWWRLVFQSAGLPEPVFNNQYSGYGLLSGVPPRCPAYFNFGMILAPAAMMTAIGSALQTERELVDGIAATGWRAQVALTLAIVRHRLPWRTTTLRYNFPLALRWYLPRFQEEWEQVRLMHYSGYKPFNMNLLMENPAAMEEWLAQESGDAVEADFRSVMRELHPGVSAFQSPEPWYSAARCNRFPADRSLTLADVRPGSAATEKWIRQDTKVVTLGSHFSEELEAALARQNFNHWSPPFEPHLHPGSNMVSALWHTFDDVFTVLQHLQWAFGEIGPPSFPWFTRDRSFFDPTESRREKIRAAFTEAGVFVVTLQTSELWRDTLTNQPAWRTILHSEGDAGRFVFVRATVAETVAALHELDGLIDRYMPGAKWIFAVAPAGLEFTCFDESAIAATHASKCILRAALDQFLADPAVRSKHRHAYFPALEIAWYLSEYPLLWESPAVKPEVSHAITGAFCAMYTDPPISAGTKVPLESFHPLNRQRALEKQLEEKERVIHELDAAVRGLERTAQDRLELIERLTDEIGKRDAMLAGRLS